MNYRNFHFLYCTLWIFYNDQVWCLYLGEKIKIKERQNFKWNQYTPVQCEIQTKRALCSGHIPLPPSLAGQAHLCLEGFSTCLHRLSSSQFFSLMPASFILLPHTLLEETFPDHSIYNGPTLLPAPLLHPLLYFSL